jgi:uncharacterized membrane protein
MRPVYPRSTIVFALAFVSLVLVGLTTPLAVSGVDNTGPGEEAIEASPDALATIQQQFDRTAFLITIYSNGSARWTFRFERTLTNTSARNDFQTYADRFTSTETDFYREFINRSNRLTASGTTATGRQMEAKNFRRDARVGRLGNEGIIEMGFQWSGFARMDGTQIIVGDVFDGGLFIRGDQRLVFRHGPDVVFAAVSPSPDSITGESLAESESVTWRGDRTFADERPRVVLVSSSVEAETGTISPNLDTTPSNPDAAASAGNMEGELPLVAGVAILLIGLGAAVAYRSGVFDERGDTSPANESSGGSGPDDGTSARPTAKSESSGDATQVVTDAELLSDTDQIIGMLEQNEGRMKQVDIVDRTGWSKSKVSMQLSEMEEAGLITKLRVGRENIIFKKGMEPEATRSPFEDDES